jgi:hypothetical protein
MDMSYRGRRGGAFIATAMACLVGTSALALAQERTKPVVQKKWRPKDGSYINAGWKLDGPCEDAAPYLLDLSKKSFIIDELSGCKITKITDTAPDALRLDMICDEVEIKGDDEGKDYKEVMILRRADDDSFFVRLTKKGKFAEPEWRVNYCPKAP